MVHANNVKHANAQHPKVKPVQLQEQYFDDYLWPCVLCNFNVILDHPIIVRERGRLEKIMIEKAIYF